MKSVVGIVRAGGIECLTFDTLVTLEPFDSKKL